MAVIPFGREFGYGTWNRLLSMPITRKRIWWEKIWVLSFSITTIWIVDLYYIHDIYQTAFKHNVNWIYERANPIIIYQTSLLYCTLLAFTFGISMSLHSRQTFVAFWRTFILVLGTLALFMFSAFFINEDYSKIKLLKKLYDNIYDSRILVQLYKRFNLEGIVLLFAVPWCGIAGYSAYRLYKNLEV